MSTGRLVATAVRVGAVLLAAVAAGGCAGFARPAVGRLAAASLRAGLADAARAIEPSVVAVTIEPEPPPAGESGRTGEGAAAAAPTAVHLTGTVLTPEGHVLVPGRYKSDYGGRIEVRIGVDAYPARPVRSSDTLNLTILKFRPRAPLAPLDRSPAPPPAAGDWLVAVVPTVTAEADERFMFPAISRGEIAGRYRRHLVESLPSEARGAPVADLRGRWAGIFDGRSVLVAQDLAEDLEVLLAEARGDGGTGTVMAARGWLGVFIEPVNRDLARRRGWPASAIWVTHVAGGSPAAKVGLRAGDVVTHVNGQAIRLYGARATEFFFQTLGNRPGQPFRLRVLREGRTLELAGRLERRPEPETLQAEDLGLTVQTVKDFDVFQRSLFVERGVLVTAVEKGSPAATGSAFGRNLIMPGDVIVEMDGRPTPDVARFRAVLDDLRARRAEVVLIRLVRGRTTDFEALNLTLGRAARRAAP
ncbi:MAG: PDZ domain-containing protein [Kiritimatiellae bacterium]|nr:PDZ domain-containing protein [Kiritimatiellia bacterium]